MATYAVEGQHLTNIANAVRNVSGSTDTMTLGEMANAISTLSTFDENHTHDEYVTEAELNAKGYITSIPSEYVTDSELNEKGYLTQHQSLADYAKKSDIATTKSVGTASGSTTYHKIYDFGVWGTGDWTKKGFSMLITSRAGETVWVTVSANDSNTSAKAIRLMDTHSKIDKIYYSASESAIYVEARAWANNICAHILTNVYGDYVPTVSTVSAIASDAVQIPIIPFGIDSDSTNVGSSSMVLNLAGSATRPAYNSNELALTSDIPTDAHINSLINTALGVIENGSY